MKKLITLFLFILLLASSAWGATYYVTQSGSGDGSAVGTPDSIADFNADVFDDLAGDTVYLMGTITTTVVFPDGGTNGNLFTLRGDYPGNPGIVAISADGVGIETNRQQYWVISNTEVTDAQAGINVTAVTAEHPETPIYGTIQDCQIHNMNYDLSAGIKIWGSNVTVKSTTGDYDDMRIYDIDQDGIYVLDDNIGGGLSADNLLFDTIRIDTIDQDNDGGDCIQFALGDLYEIKNSYLDASNSLVKGVLQSNEQATTSGLIHHNTIIISNGATNYGISAMPTAIYNNHFINNGADNSGGRAIELDVGVPVVAVYNNIIDGFFQGVYSRETGADVTLYNNTIVNCQRPIDGYTANENDLAAYNNIIEVEGFLIFSTGPTYVGDNNIFYPEAANYLRIDGVSYSTLASWATATSQDANSIAADPLFVNPAGGDFQLLVGSSAIDAGIFINGLHPSSDFEGKPCPIGFAPDIGAYERDTESPKPPQNFGNRLKAS